MRSKLLRLSLEEYKLVTHNPKESRATCESTLEYIYRGESHEHEVGSVIHLGGNLLSPDPIYRDRHGFEVNLEQIAYELNVQAGLHRGKGEDLFKHYVISLASDEELKDYEWLEFVTGYMHALGYDNSTKWTAAIHKDTDYEHVHILACRVKNDKHGSLVSTFKDYQLGWPVMREYEKKFGLQQLTNPDENFGFNKSKRQLKHEAKFGAISSLDEAALIRAAFNKLYSIYGKPKNMRDLVLGLAKCGVDVNVSSNSENEITGISYQLKSGSGKWISGSKVKATRFTWKALQTKEGISYDPRRDDPFLRKDDCDYEIYINLKNADAHYMRIFESKFRMQEQKFLLARFRRTQEMNLDAIMLLIKLILIILKILFGIKLDQDEFEFCPIRCIHESPDLDESRNIDNDILQRVCRRYDVSFDSLNAVDFSLNSTLMSIPMKSYEMSY
jgi:hypothetical protein